MAVQLDVSMDIREIERQLTVIQRKHVPPAVSSALNKTARTARTDGNRAVAKDLKLPIRIVSKRFDNKGKVKGDRTKLFRASRSRPQASLVVNLRGIPLTQIATIQTKLGVKARGGRLYLGAFLTRQVQGGAEIALKRRGKARTPTFQPRIGLQDRLVKQYKARTQGFLARAIFNTQFRLFISRRLNRRL